MAVLISVFIRRPFGFFDEQVHYFRAIGVSNGQLLSYSKDNDKSKLGHDIKISQLKFEELYLSQKDDVITAEWVNDRTIDGDSSQTQYKVNTSAVPYTPVAYTPFAVASRLSQAIGINVKNEFILMRLFGAISALTTSVFCL